MEIGDIIKAIMKDRKVTQYTMGAFMSRAANGLSRDLSWTPNAISDRIKMLEYLGYEVVVREKRPGRRAEGEYVVTAGEGRKDEIVDALTAAGVDEREIGTIAANTDLIVNDAPVYNNEEKPAPKSGESDIERELGRIGGGQCDRLADEEGDDENVRFGKMMMRATRAYNEQRHAEEEKSNPKPQRVEYTDESVDPALMQDLRRRLDDIK